MKITYVVAVLIYVLFFKRVSNKKNFFMELLLFSAIVAPGVRIAGILVNLIDFVIPVMFVYYFIFKSRKIKLSNVEAVYLLYVISIFVSILANVFAYASLITAALQAVRTLSIVAFICLFKQVNGQSDNAQILNSINVYGIWLGIISIIAFWEQGTIYDPLQYLWIGGLELARAAGVFGESSYLGFIMVLLFITGYNQCKSKIKNHRYNAIAVMILATICNILSYSRITNLALIIVMAVTFFRRLSYKKLAGLLSLCIVGVVLVSTVDFAREFVFNRMLGFLDNLDFNSLSSGRGDVWQAAFDAYAQGSVLFGIGYKNGLFADNNFIMSLTQMGLFGFIVNLIFVLYLFYESIRTKSFNLALMSVTVLVISMTCDVLTYYRPLCLLFVLFNLFKNKKAVTENQNYSQLLLQSNLCKDAEAK